MKILFMTQRYSLLGAKCLYELIEEKVNVIEVFVSKRKRMDVRTVGKYIRRNGVWFFVGKMAEIMFKEVRIFARKKRAAFLKKLAKGCKSVGEVLANYPLKTYEVPNVNSGKFIEIIEKLEADLVITCDFPQILKKEILKIPKIGCINVHPSLLPQYRGPNPIFWPLFYGEGYTGVSIHYLEEAIDSGDIISQRRIRIEPSDSEKTLLFRVSKVAAEELVKAVGQIEKKNIFAVKQDEKKVSYFRRPSKEDRRELKKAYYKEKISKLPLFC